MNAMTLANDIGRDWLHYSLLLKHSSRSLADGGEVNEMSHV